MSCPQCFTGHENPGSPQGQFKSIYGRRTYVAEPADGKEPEGIVVIIPDAFGVGFINNQILADHYASAGPYLVYLPDFMDGTEASVQSMKSMALVTEKSTPWLLWLSSLAGAISTFIPFLIRNRFGVSWPKVQLFLLALREDRGATLPVAAAGFCWGGLHAVYLTHDRPDATTPSGHPLVDAVFTAHPSNLSVPGDFEKVARNLAVAIGDNDAVMGIAQVEDAKRILAAKASVDSEVKVYPGAKHGFAVRASKADPDSRETQQAGEAEQQAVAWFKKQFAAAKRA